MASDFEIGRVVAVDTAQVTVQLNSDLKGLARSTYEGVQEIGRINSYVVLPVCARRLIAMVTRVVLVEDCELKANETSILLPSARRLLKATLIGTIDGSSYTQGVVNFPVLDNPVHLATAEDIRVIFDHQIVTLDGGVRDTEDPGYIVHLGESPIFPDCPIKLHPDALFGKHAAVLGSTGTGKSCTVAALLQSILSRPEVRRTHFVILDTNGEYRTAFQRQKETGEWEDVSNGRCLYIPSDPRLANERLVIPYWFMNADDFVRLFQASKGVQRPVLLEALRLSRNVGTSRNPDAVLREELVHELNRIWSLSGRDEKTSKDLRDLASGLLHRMDDEDVAAGWDSLGAADAQLSKENVRSAIESVKSEAQQHIEGAYPKVIPADARNRIRDAIDPIYSSLTGAHLGAQIVTGGISADTPAFFDKVAFRSRHVEQVLRREESGGNRARDYSGTMLLRIDRLLQDRRFEFLLGPCDGQFPKARHALATFLRHVMGAPSAESPDPPLSDDTSVAPGQLPFYDSQRAASQGHNVTILDLSLLAAEVLENVTALIGRLLLEFLQRLGEYGGESVRGSLPIVLVLEEAQNYIREPRFGDDESISRLVFERVAREGRKFGLGLVVASQRPSELSRTVLSQCSSFIVHRLQNPEDLRYFKEIVPAVYGPLLDQLPALARQTALVLGECVRAPALVRIRDARPIPRSRDPKFYRYWTQTTPQSVNVEAVCARWDGTEFDAVNPDKNEDEDGPCQS